MTTIKVKKQNIHKICHKKRKYEDYRNCLEATQLEHKIIHPRFIKNHKEFMKKIKQY